MAPARKEMNAHDLRAKCKELGIAYTWRVDGAKFFLTIAELEVLVKNAGMSLEASTKYACEPQHRPRAPSDVHLFWDNPKALLSGKPSPAVLPQCGLLGLWSICRLGWKAHLWTYSVVSNVFRHSNIQVSPAASFLPLDEAVALLRRNLRIQHLADLVRVLAVQDIAKRCGRGSWVGDVDQIWFRPCGFPQ